MKFLDEARIYVKSGAGGAGAVSFRREKYIEFGGPDGGNGGKGGDIVVVAAGNLNTLIDYRYQQHFKAPIGGHGMGQNRTGAMGEDVVLKVPLGTEIIEAETGIVLADMLDEGQTFILLPGGRGGRGNASYKSSTNRAPRQHTLGVPAVEMEVILRLKLVADIGLLGLPNAGKSTFVAGVSKARPKIADYAFTTLKPALGVVRHAVAGSAGSGVDFVVADLPGLVEGAAEGIGLGHQFLKHMSRCAGMLHLIDAGQPEPWVSYKKIRKELVAYDAEFDTELAVLPEVVALSKVDLLSDEDVAQIAKDFQKKTKTKPLLLSVKNGDGLNVVLDRLAGRVSEARAARVEAQADIVPLVETPQV